MTRRAATLSIVAGITSRGLYAGLGSTKAEYVGGTWVDLKQGTEGELLTNEAARAIFRSGKGREFLIPYESVTSLEYGQKAGRRVGAAIGWGVTTLGVAALPLLLSKKRKHYFSIGFTGEDGSNQGVVLELGKDITRPVLKTFEVRTGKKIEYESEEAKKNIGN
jgi:hypothetical protein